MMYLSRGLPVDAPYNDEVRICLHGKAYALGPKLAALWNNARRRPQQIAPNNTCQIERMAQSGLAVVTEEIPGRLAAYRLLSQCILCPTQKWERRGWLPLFGRDKRIWTWISGAGLRLTTCELIRLEEQNLSPVPALLGDANRRALVDMIYMQMPMEDVLLVTAMEHSPKRDATVSSLLRLLQAHYLFLA